VIVEEATTTGLRIRLDSALYTEAVVYKCFYWYGNEFDVVVERASEEGALVVELRPRRPRFSTEDLLALQSRVKRDLVDFKTRDIVARETQAVRELLVAKAFANSDEYDEPPIGSVADMAGLDAGGLKHERR
jgi:His-Xaa-Ser system protein HxsD